MAALPTIKDGKGEERTLRPLGYEDLCDLADIIAQAHKVGRDELLLSLRSMDHQEQADVFASSVLLGTPSVRKPLRRWLASVVEATPEEFGDPRVFPLGSVAQLIRELVKHPDVRAFFFELVGAETARALLATARETVSGWLSTYSSPATEEPGESG